MWLATTEKIFLSGASIILSRNDAASFIVYPISNPDPEIDLSTINWIAETALNPTIQVDKEYWRRGMIKRPLCANLQRLRFRLDKMRRPLLKALTPF